jgi:NADH:ubiquinone oxidoreductase subunit 6 (subunit J)
MTPDILGFWVLAVTLVGSALMVVLTKNLFHSVLWLALGLVSTAGVFLLLDAEFLASVQVLLYAGGVITVVVFAIVVTEKLVGERLSSVSRRMVIGAALSAGLLTVLLKVIGKAEIDRQMPEATADFTRWMGISLLTQHVVAFELLAILLVAGMLAATYFARPEE